MGGCLQGNTDNDLKIIAESTLFNNEEAQSDSLSESEESISVEILNEPLDKAENSEITSYLICGYMRNEIHCSIREIINLCIKFYGRYTPHLIYMIGMKEQKKTNNWYSSKIADDCIDIICTQYIDETYQVFGMKHQQFIINMNTNKIYMILAYLGHDTDIIMDDMHLLINTLDYDASNNWPWKAPYYDGFIGSSRIWKEFENNLWELFVMNRLYDPTQDIEKQEIWRIIQFLSMIYLPDGREAEFPGWKKLRYFPPKLILRPSDRPRLYFDTNEFPNGRFSKRNLRKKYKTFDVNTDCNAKIIEYKKDKLLFCKCYLYIDWGAGKGCNKILYESRFKISKMNHDKLEIKIYFDVVQRYLFHIGSVYRVSHRVLTKDPEFAGFYIKYGDKLNLFCQKCLVVLVVKRKQNMQWLKYMDNFDYMDEDFTDYHIDQMNIYGDGYDDGFNRETVIKMEI